MNRYEELLQGLHSIEEEARYQIDRVQKQGMFGYVGITSGLQALQNQIDKLVEINKQEI